MHIVRFTYSLNLVVILLNTYIMFFIIRFFIPFSKQIIFNRLYRFVYYTTEPVLRLFGKRTPAKAKTDRRALLVTIIFAVLYSLFWILDNPQKSIYGGLIYMLASFVTYFFYLFSFAFLSEFFILMRGPYSYGEFARIIHFSTDYAVSPVRRLFPGLSRGKRDYAPLTGLLFVLFLSSLCMTMLSGLLGDAVSFMENLGRGLEADVNMFAYLWVMLIILRTILSWFVVPESNFFQESMIFLTEPVLQPLRKVFPPYKIGMDFTPVISIAVILIIKWALILIIDFLF